MTDLLLVPIAIVLLLGWSPVLACALWVLGMMVCALAWSGIFAAVSTIGRLRRVR